MATNTDLSIFQGTDKTYTVTVTDSAGDAIDITGYTFLFTVKRNKRDADSDAIISKNVTSHTDPTAGETAIAIDRADTLNQKIIAYPYDIQMIDTSSKRIEVMYGDFKIEDAITERDI